MPKTVPWNHNIHYHEALLRVVPAGCGQALDVGCGAGLLACRLGERCGTVVALDLAVDVFRCNRPNVRFVAGDVMTCDLPAGNFDCVTAVAMLHHVALVPGLERLGELVRPGGVLVIVGLYRRSGLADFFFDAVAWPVSRVLGLARGKVGADAAVRMPEVTLPEIRAAAEVLLPGAVVRRKLLFRYVLEWHKLEPGR